MLCSLFFPPSPSPSSVPAKLPMNQLAANKAAAVAAAAAASTAASTIQTPQPLIAASNSLLTPQPASSAPSATALASQVQTPATNTAPTEADFSPLVSAAPEPELLPLTDVFVPLEKIQPGGSVLASNADFFSFFFLILVCWDQELKVKPKVRLMERYVGGGEGG